MTRSHGKATGLALGLGIVLAVVGSGRGRAQDPEGTGERVGERVGEAIDRAGKAIRRGVGEASETVQQGFARTRAAVHNMGVESRVYGRLHWDKALTDAAIELDASQDGVITLRGAVPDAAAKGKALALAQETVGVTQVVDQLTIGPVTTPGSTTTTTTIERTPVPPPAPEP
jgi:hyperosmotically inducible periplasmic protein